MLHRRRSLSRNFLASRRLFHVKRGNDAVAAVAGVGVVKFHPASLEVVDSRQRSFGRRTNFVLFNHWRYTNMKDQSKRQFTEAAHRQGYTPMSKTQSLFLK